MLDVTYFGYGVGLVLVGLIAGIFVGLIFSVFRKVSGG